MKSIARRAVLTAPFLLAGCGSILPERPYEVQRQWPITVRRPVALPPRRRGKVLLVRSLRAGPGLGDRGLETLNPDGSVSTAYYEQWAVPPAEGVEDSLRRWLADSGLFVAVVGLGSRLNADLVLEGELTTLITDLGAKRARAALAFVLVDQHGSATKVLVQRTVSAEEPLASTDPAEEVRAQKAAIAAVLAQIEAAVAPFA
jgi:cholesterol transport system auxiliary component